MMHRLFKLSSSLHVAAMWLFAFLLAAPTAVAVAGHPAQSASELRIAMPAPHTLDPTTLSRFDLATRDVVENLFVGLTRFNPHSGLIEPMLAKSWSVSEDGLTWTFELRDDISWVRYNAQAQTVEAVRPVTAGDVVYAIQRACDPTRPSPMTANLMVVRGCLTVANAFPEVINDLFIAREIGARATGPYTLQLELLFPTGYLPSLLSTPEFRPLPREAVTAAQDWTHPSTILTNGPFVLQSWTGQGMSLARNPFWPDASQGAIDQVSIVFTGESNSAVVLTAAGQVDFARLSADEIDQARATLPAELHLEQGTTLTVLGFSFERSMVDKPEVRRALAIALDRAALVRDILGNRALPATGFIPTGMVGSPVSPAVAQRDPALAQSNYAAAGYPNCNSIPEPLTLFVANDDPVWLALGQAIVAQWTDALGCNPNLFQVETVSRTLLIELSHSTYDAEKLTRPHAWLGTWSADYPDANGWLNDALHCRYGYFRVGRPCDTADDLLDRAGSEIDIAARAQLYAQAEQVFFALEGTFPVVPLFYSANAWLQAPRLGNVNAVSAARFDTWSLAGEN